MLGQTASDAMILSLTYAADERTLLPGPLDWWSTGSAWKDSPQRIPPPHTPPSVCSQGGSWQVEAANRIGLRSRERRFESCRGHSLEA